MSSFKNQFYSQIITFQNDLHGQKSINYSESEILKSDFEFWDKFIVKNFTEDN